MKSVKVFLLLSLSFSFASCNFDVLKSFLGKGPLEVHIDTPDFALVPGRTYPFSIVVMNISSRPVTWTSQIDSVTGTPYFSIAEPIYSARHLPEEYSLEAGQKVTWNLLIRVVQGAPVGKLSFRLRLDFKKGSLETVESDPVTVNVREPKGSLKQLTKELRNPNNEVFYYAIEDIRLYREEGLDPLMKYLNEQPDDRRMGEILKAIKQVGTAKSKEALALVAKTEGVRLITRLSDSRTNWYDRSDILYLLADIPEFAEGNEDLITKQLGDSDQLVKYGAALALEKIPTEKAQKAFRAQVLPLLRQEIAQRNTVPPKGTSFERAKWGREHAGPPMSFFEILKEVPPSVPIDEIIRMGLKSKDPIFVRNIMDVVVHRKSLEMIPLIIERLKNQDEDSIRYHACKTLDKMQAANKAVPELIKYFHSQWDNFIYYVDQPGYRAPLEALVGSNTPEAEKLIERFRDILEERILRLNYELKINGPTALRRKSDKVIGTYGKPDRVKLEREMQRRDLRDSYAYDLSLLKSYAIPAVGTIATLVGADNLDVHAAAVTALKRIGDTTAKQALQNYKIQAIKSLSTPQCCYACERLAAFGPDADDIVPDLINHLPAFPWLREKEYECIMKTLRAIGTPRALASVK